MGVVSGTNVVTRMTDNRITLEKEKDIMIWGIANDKLACLDYDSYRKLGLTPAVKKFTFTMKLMPVGENNYEYLRALIKP